MVLAVLLLMTLALMVLAFTVMGMGWVMDSNDRFRSVRNRMR